MTQVSARDLERPLDGSGLSLLAHVTLVVSVDLLLDSLDGLVGERLVFEHCFVISFIIIVERFCGYLQKASSSSVRP